MKYLSAIEDRFEPFLDTDDSGGGGEDDDKNPEPPKPDPKKADPPKDEPDVKTYTDEDVECAPCERG